MRILCSLPLLLLAVATTAAQTSYPMITYVTPVAVQRGKTVEVTVEGQMNFAAVYKALFEGTGITAEVVGAAPRPAAGAMPQVRSCKLRLTVAPDAVPGVREFRVASALGVSSIGQLLVCDVPVLQESGNNNTLQQANQAPVPGVISGRIEAAEDVDYFRFRAVEGQTFTFEVLCARLQDKIHDLQKHADPMLSLYDSEGRELAANDDFYFADPQLTYTFRKSGDYYIQVRDSKYDGDPRWVYALKISDHPQATHIYPMAANPGQAVEVEPVGSLALKQPRVALVAPKSLGLQAVQLSSGLPPEVSGVPGSTPDPVPLLVSPLPQVLEVEPNDTPQTAQRVSLPCGINGRIGKPRDLDHFVFKGTKDKAVRLEVHARRFGTLLTSHLDSMLEVLDAKGKVLAGNDDANGKDSALVFTPPADGDYILRIRDLNGKGGPTFLYYLEADLAQPDFTLRCDSDKAMIGPGTSTAWFLQVDRLNGFTGPVQVEVKGLPRGVKVNPLTIPASMTQGILVLTAEPGAELDAANVEVIGQAAVTINGKEQQLQRRATPLQEIYFPGGGRGVFPVNLHTVGVTEKSDILAVEVTPTEVVLKPGQEVRLEVTLKRRPDYDKGVSLDILLRHLGRIFGNPLPPGVTIVEGKSKTLLGNASKGHIVLRAAPDAAEVEKVPISVLAHVSVNFVVKVSYSSPAILLSVRK